MSKGVENTFKLHEQIDNTFHTCINFMKKLAHSIFKQENIQHIQETGKQFYSNHK